mgnify:FL=1
MEIVGKIKVINPEFAVSASFKKRELVVVTDEQYPQSILLEFQQDKCIILDNYKVGEDVKVGINLRGREWVNPQGESKYFNTIIGWRIERSAAGQYSPPPTQSPVDQYFDKNKKEPINEEEDGLPF